MDNMLEKIYKYVYIGSYAINGMIILLFNLNAQAIKLHHVLITIGVVTFILFLMGRLVQERFDNTLQMYLIIISCAFLVSAFFKKDMGGEVGFAYGWITFWTALTSVAFFAAAFFLDDFFESE